MNTEDALTLRNVIFFRKEGWYPVQLRPGETVKQHVDLNPGTLRVEDAESGVVLWTEAPKFPELFAAISREKARPLPERIELLTAALAGLPDHWQQWQWMADPKPVFGDRSVRSVYGDNGHGMGRQAIAIVPADKHYFGTLADFIAAANPDTITMLLASYAALLASEAAAIQERDALRSERADVIRWLDDRFYDLGMEVERGQLATVLKGLFEQLAATALASNATIIQERDAALAKVAEAFQQRVAPWMQECFGPVISADRRERSDRFLEEALELTQAADYTADRAHALVDYVFGRPKGELVQEAGGVMVTLAAFALAHDLDMHDAGEVELARICQPEIILRIRAKQAAKARDIPFSPLPSAGVSA